MSAEPTERTEQRDVIHLGGEQAVVVPLVEYRALKALAGKATDEEREDAWMDAAIAEHEDWIAAGRPSGTIPHELAVEELEAARRSMGLGDED